MANFGFVTRDCSGQAQMTLTPDELKNAALAERDGIEARVNGVQSGVPTYFDALFLTFLSNLQKTETLHAWNNDPKQSADANARAVAELQWLECYLTRRMEGRLVPYDIRRTDDKTGGQSDIRS